MIVSLTPNTTLDLTVFVPRLLANTTIRASRTYQSMGGKPTDAAFILGKMGIGSLALGLAAGVIGSKVQSMLEAVGVETAFLPADGETRVNTVIIDEHSGEHTTITTASMSVKPSQLAALSARYIQALDEATVVIMGGSLPPGVQPDFYAEAIALANARGLPVIFDAAPPNLDAGLSAGPAFIKPNQAELSALVGRELRTLDELHQAGSDILARTGTQVLISMGGDGALAVLDGRSYRIPAITVELSSPAGAGDAMLAGLASAIHQRQPIEEGLRLGIATATAVCMQPGTADYQLDDMRRLLPQVELLAYP